MRIGIYTIAAAITAVAIAQSQPDKPIRPPSPIIIRTDVGQVAGLQSRITVNCFAIVNRDEEFLGVFINDTGALGPRALFLVDDLQKVADAMDQAAAACNAGKDFTIDIAQGKISVYETGNTVFLHLKHTVGIDRSEVFRMDCDNAASMARLMHKAQTMLKWMEPNLKPFRKHDVWVIPSKEIDNFFGS